MNTYKITCTNCKNSETVNIDARGVIIWGKTKNIISGRKRLDGHYGWQCLCGNNDIMTRQEERQIKNKQNPDPQDIKEILLNLKPDKPLFVMERL